MTHIGQSLVPQRNPHPPENLGVDPVDVPTAKVEVDPVALDKAKLVLRMFSAASLKPQFGFEPEEAAPLWAVQIGKYPPGVLSDSVQEWIASETEFPTLKDFDTICELTLRELTKASKPKVERTGPCEECDGNRWVRVGDGPDSYDTTPGGKRYVPGKGWIDDPTVLPERILVRNYHMEPCGSCDDMQDRSELYPHHMTAEHIDRGGCSVCRPYMHHCAKSKSRR